MTGPDGGGENRVRDSPNLFQKKLRFSHRTLVLSYFSDFILFTEQVVESHAPVASSAAEERGR